MNELSKQPKGLVVAGLSGGAGKSVAAVGLVAALSRRGMRVTPFKKGPDYIDAGWLSGAASSPCYNLDPYLMSSEALLENFSRHGGNGEMVLVEGNRGLYDGVDPEGTYSTAGLAVQLGLPVLLVVNCTKTTRTVAAMVLGCRHLDPRVDIRGVVLNQVGTARHEKLVREAVERYAGVPVLGAFPRLPDVFPQRHLGVTPCAEHGEAREAIAALADAAERYLDIDGILALTRPSSVTMREADVPARPAGAGVRIGVIRDAAFQFYYQENLEALVGEGAELVEINALVDPELPEIDGLYIGGGFPETNARYLAGNGSFRRSMKERIEAGLPVYAECGGLIYLGEAMVLDGEEFPLVGVFPVRYGLEKRPQAHGYTTLKVDGANPFYAAGTEIRGHEFRYSRVLDWSGRSEELALAMTRGVGFVGGRDGLVYKNVLALYTHIHAVGVPQWAGALVARAREWRRV
ncbi:MAG: hydrogenobyrinic acid a,c-diamide synthase (glutamine-hydrolyzing) [Desulfobulbaceae bacterium]|nr:hydrogenobyrinic acid a,c-diamide synthase (glutamine-hydrolyzing) [Desulfobulbaceae bacterium]